MSYHIYTTRAIILKRKVYGESDTVLYCLTRDLGLIIASARSTRLMSSKLRASLQEFSLLDISCVKGKNGWKVTNAISDNNLFFSCPDDHRKVLVQISSILIKNIVGEMVHKEVFDVVKDAFTTLIKIRKEDLKDFEVLVVLKLMKEFGYVASENELGKYFDDRLSLENLLPHVKMERVRLVGLINKALKESQL